MKGFVYRVYLNGVSRDFTDEDKAIEFLRELTKTNEFLNGEHISMFIYYGGEDE